MRLEGYSNYEIDPEAGTVWSYKSNRFIGAYDKDKYISVCLINDKGDKKMISMHRLIWTVVNGEIPKGMEINHIDENKENNSILNLSLVTHKENTNWGTRNERIIKNRVGKFKEKPVIRYINGNINGLFKSSRDAERKTGVCNVTIGRLCQKPNIIDKSGWRYLEDQLADWLEEIQDEDIKKERVA